MADPSQPTYFPTVGARACACALLQVSSRKLDEEERNVESAGRASLDNAMNCAVDGAAPPPKATAPSASRGGGEVPEAVSRMIAEKIEEMERRLMNKLGDIAKAIEGMKGS